MDTTLATLFNNLAGDKSTIKLDSISFGTPEGVLYSLRKYPLNAYGVCVFEKDPAWKCVRARTVLGGACLFNQTASAQGVVAALA